MKKYSNLFAILGAILLLFPYFIINVIGTVLIVLAFLNGNASKGSKKTGKTILSVALVISVIVFLFKLLLPGSSGVSILGIPVMTAGSIQFVLTAVSFVLLSLKK